MRPVNGSGVAADAPAANLTTRSLLVSATYTLPAVSTATPWGFFRPVNGSGVAADAPAGNFTTRSLPHVGDVHVARRVDRHAGGQVDVGER